MALYLSYLAGESPVSSSVWARIFKLLRSQESISRNQFRQHLAWRDRTGICRPFKDPRNGFPAWRMVQQPYLSYRPARLHKLVESIPRKWFLSSIYVYKNGLCTTSHRLFKNSRIGYNSTCIPVPAVFADLRSSITRYPLYCKYSSCTVHFFNFVIY